MSVTTPPAPAAARPLLMATNAGHGVTPPVPDALFQRGDVVKVSRRREVVHFPAEAVVAVAVPPGFPAAYALADLLGEPRPLMITRPLRGVSYILVVEGDRTPYHARESYLRPSGKPRVEIGSVVREGAEGVGAA